jgi:hypothetical protein
MRSRRLWVVTLLAVLGIAAARDAMRLGDALPWRTMYDFADFYCAGAALDAHRSPYEYEPLHTCEHRVNASDAFLRIPQLAVPAPQPPYDFPPYMLLGSLPFSVARAIAAAAIVAAVALSALALSRLGIELGLALSALALPAAYLELNAGQMAPFAFLFVALCGAALALRRGAWAGAFAALTMIEPHVGLPILLATFIFERAARWSIALGAVALAAVGLATVGPRLFVGYLLEVLPIHARSEIGFPYQYSVTYVAHYFGAAPHLALLLGNASYLAMIALSLWFAPRVAAALDRREVLAYFPAACAVTGGPYVHMVELCFAIPLALVLATRLRGPGRIVSAMALCALIVPWIQVWAIKKLLLASIFFCALVLVQLDIAAVAAVATLAAVGACAYLFELSPPRLPVFSMQGSYDPWVPVSLVLGSYVAQLDTHSIAWLAIKLPSWLALIALQLVALIATRWPDGSQARSRVASAPSRGSWHETRRLLQASPRARTG